MENLGIDGKLLLAQVINFVLFFILVKQFMVKPFTGFLNQERKNEEDKNKMLEKLKRSEEAGIEAERKMKEKMKKEFDVLFVEAKKEATVLRSEMMDLPLQLLSHDSCSLPLLYLLKFLNQPTNSSM